MKAVLEFNYPEDADNLKKFVQSVGGREWVGLTDEDLAGCDESEYKEARYWEAKLREKNT